MVEINWTINALEDVHNIAEFIALDSEHYASMVVESFFTRIQILEHNIQAGKLVPELSNPFVRELIEGNYRIIYRVVNDQQLDILTIHHGSRLLSNNPTLNPPQE
jgi:addiction module RelE/StbE family toxin